MKQIKIVVTINEEQKTTEVDFEQNGEKMDNPQMLACLMLATRCINTVTDQILAPKPPQP